MDCGAAENGYYLMRLLPAFFRERGGSRSNDESSQKQDPFDMALWALVNADFPRLRCSKRHHFHLIQVDQGGQQEKLSNGVKTSNIKSSVQQYFSLLIVCSSLVFNGCGRQTVADVTGNYEGRYFGGVETFALNPDGKFAQEFTVNHSSMYTNHGTWFLKGRTLQFQNFMKAYWFTDKEFHQFRTPLDEFIAKIPVGADAIIFSNDGDYFARKK